MNTFLGDEFSTYMEWRANIRKYNVYQNIADDSLDDIKEKLVYERIILYFGSNDFAGKATLGRIKMRFVFTSEQNR